MNSNELFELSKKYVPGGVHSPVRSFKGLHTTPRFMNHADKALITDEEGISYIDFCMSFGPMILGHRNQKVEASVTAALKNGWSFGACEKYSLELAKYIVDRISFIEQIRFVNSGTEAVMTAIRLARGYTKRNKIIKFEGCYHGHTDSMLIKAGSGLAGKSAASSAGIAESCANDTLVGKLGDIEFVKTQFKNHPNDIAAVFIEPLPANNGLLIQERSYLIELQKICKEHGALLVFDEVISGFRVAFGGMAEILEIQPDLVTYGKIIGGGFPVGAVAGKASIMEKLAPLGDVYQAGTLSANPIAMVAGLENLKQLDENFYKRLDTYSENIYQIFNEWLKQSEFSDYHLIHYKSLFWAIPTNNKISSPDDIPAELGERFVPFFETLLNKGIYLSPNAYEVGFISIAHDDSLAEDLKKKLWN